MSNDKTIEQQITALQEKMAWFHSDAFSLDEAAARYKEIDDLAAVIEARLQETKQEIEVLQQRFDQ